MRKETLTLTLTPLVLPLEAFHVLQELFTVLADEGLLVVAGDVVPLDAILVDVVEDAHARLGGLVDVELGVVGLRSSGVTLVAPGLVPPAGGSAVGVGHLGVGVGPEPSLNVDGLQVFTLGAAREVTEAARRPDVGDVAWRERGRGGVRYSGRWNRETQQTYMYSYICDRQTYRDAYKGTLHKSIKEGRE